MATSGGEYVTRTSDIKEFIKKLKINLKESIEHSVFHPHLDIFFLEIDKLAGEKLK